MLCYFIILLFAACKGTSLYGSRPIAGYLNVENNRCVFEEAVKYEQNGWRDINDYTWSGGEKNILQFTTGTKNAFGYHFPTFNLDKHNELKIYMPKVGDLDYNFKTWTGTEQGQTWLHFTAAVIQQESDSTNEEYEMSLRVNGNLVLEPEPSTIENNYDDIIVYGSNSEKESLADAYYIDKHEIHNLRIMKERKSKTMD